MHFQPGQGGVELEFEAGVGARPQALDAQRLQLTVEGLDALAPGAQDQLVGPPVRAHVGLADRDQAYPSVRQDRGLVRRPIVALIALHGRLVRQPVGQRMDGRQVMQPAGEQVEGHRHARRGTPSAPSSRPSVAYTAGALA